MDNVIAALMICYECEFLEEVGQVAEARFQLLCLRDFKNVPERLIGSTDWIEPI